MWSLVVLILGTIPPQGVVVKDLSETECVEQNRRYCDGDRKFRCKCERQ